jgi:16S rRNA (cytidine1402-2'-O)-methyltransferase
VGFLPRRERERSALWSELGASPWPTVAFESPKRLPATLRSLAAADPHRVVAVCRELTKRFEEVVSGPAEEIAERFAEPPKGEITLVIGGGGPEPDLEAARTAVADLVAAGTPRRVAADVVSRLTETSRNDLYRGTL